MPEIQLTQDLVALVSDEDYESLSKHNWCAVWQNQHWKAARNVQTAKGRRTSYMHREILNCVAGEEVDHVNRNTLDNRRENLRKCNRQQNMANTGPRKGKYKGVDFHLASCRYRARISVSGKSISLGYHSTEEDAARAYDKAAVEHFGEFAYTNFPPE